MPGFDMAIELALSPEVAEAAVVRALALHEGQLVFSAWPINGDFRTAISIDFPDKLELEPSQAASQIVRHLGCRGLIGDDSVNPFSYLLVSPDAAIRQVFIEPEGLNETPERLTLKA